VPKLVLVTKLSGRSRLSAAYYAMIHLNYRFYTDLTLPERAGKADHSHRNTCFAVRLMMRKAVIAALTRLLGSQERLVTYLPFCARRTFQA
jgi:hypothetical protein